MGNSVSVRTEETGDMERLLSDIDVTLRRKAARDAVRAAGNVVAKRARQLCQRSARTGTRKHWSNNTESQRQGVKPLADTIGVVVRDYGDVFVAIVGPQYPAGALGHLVEFGHAWVAWGQVTSEEIKPSPFMRPAADETTSEQVAALTNKLTSYLPR